MKHSSRVVQKCGFKRSQSICVVGDGWISRITEEIARKLQHFADHRVRITYPDARCICKNGFIGMRYARNHGVPRIMRIIGYIAEKTYHYGAHG